MEAFPLTCKLVLISYNILGLLDYSIWSYLTCIPGLRGRKFLLEIPVLVGLETSLKEMKPESLNKRSAHELM